MHMKRIALVALVAGAVAGCSQPAPIVDVQLPEQTAGRWTMQVLPPSGFGSSPDYLFLDTATGTVCVLELSDLATSHAAPSSMVGTLSVSAIGEKCKKLP
ncbi:hypothetical protein [Pseudoxanthomonas japonensis]|uniref:hypothetical protein n=1 Tax=Pseudoxanthomonas japonensis TaxID=69284 RepID=UPI001BCE2D9C|nr:hypothetical protein [Pseudoxanthomonas japonensis]